MCYMYTQLSFLMVGLRGWVSCIVKLLHVWEQLSLQSSQPHESNHGMVIKRPEVTFPENTLCHRSSELVPTVSLDPESSGDLSHFGPSLLVFVARLNKGKGHSLVPLEEVSASPQRILEGVNPPP